MLGLFTSFLLLGPFALDLPEFGLGLRQTAVILTIVYVLSTLWVSAPPTQKSRALRRLS